MRDIEFKGKRVDNGEWIAGDLLQDFHGAYINPASVLSTEMNADFIEVYPKTVGQLIGITDKNGKEAFNGDKARFMVDGKAVEGFLEYETCYYVLTGYGAISRLFNKGCDFVIIGNIHEATK